MPIAVLPPISQVSRVRPLAVVTGPARSRAAYEADIAIRTESVACGGSYTPVIAASAEIARRNSLSRLSRELASVQENASDASGRRICGRQGSQQLPGGFAAASFAAFYSAQEQIEGIDLDGPSCHITFETVSSDWLPGSAHNFPGESR